jgi:hypothetical protein
VSGKVDPSVKQRCVELLGGETLSAGLGEMAVQNAIIACRDRFNFKARVMTGCRKRREHKLRLPECMR